MYRTPTSFQPISVDVMIDDEIPQSETERTSSPKRQAPIEESIETQVVALTEASPVEVERFQIDEKTKTDVSSPDYPEKDDKGIAGLYFLFYMVFFLLNIGYEI